MNRAYVFKKVLLHVAVWIGVLSIPFLLRPDVPVRPIPLEISVVQPAPHSREVFFIVQNLLLIGFFYLNYALLLPRMLIVHQRRWAYFGVILLCLIVFQGILAIYQDIVFTDIGRSHGERFFQKFGFMAATFLFALSWAASSGIRLSTEWKKAEDRRRESENARLNTELSQLKSQLNPHFLFNTLHGIYALALAKNDAAPDAVLKLSYLLRYVMAETNLDVVPFERDLEHLRHFVALHQMRLTAKTPVSFHVEGDPAGHRIAPLLLLPFVENAFKFGSSAREESPIDIAVKIWENRLEFICQNHLRSTADHSTGIGIANTRRRLELLYPGRYELKIGEEEAIFRVTLKIDL